MGHWQHLAAYRRPTRAERLEVSKLQDWKAGMQKVIWLIATAAGGMWVKHFMDLMMK